MILDANATKVEVEEIGSSFRNQKAKITAKNTPYIFSLLAKIYSKPKESIVREVTSNGFDGFIALNKLNGINSLLPEQVVIVRLYIDDTGQNYLEFVDQGIGISQYNMDEIYMSYGESDKRESDDFIGAFGLGSKSPFSYSNFFYVITKSEGIEYTYLLNSTQLGPEYDCLLQQEVPDGSTGTIVRVPLKKEDIGLFEKAILSELKYFTNVFVVGFPKVKNEYTIHRYENFQIREDLFLEKNDNYLHLVIGNVTYPINFEQLDERPIKFNAALTFNIGDLQVAPNREELQYEDSTKLAIKNKLEAFKKELKSYIFDEKNLQCDNLLDFRAKAIKLKDSQIINNITLLPNQELKLDLNHLNLTNTNIRYKLLLGGQYLLIDFSILNPEGYSKVLFARGKNSYALRAVKVKDREKNKTLKSFEDLDNKYTIIDNNKDKLKVSERAWLNEKIKTLKVLQFDKLPLIEKFSKFLFEHNIFPDIPEENLYSINIIKDIIEEFYTKYNNEILGKNFVYLNDMEIPLNYGKKQREYYGKKNTQDKAVEDGNILYTTYSYKFETKITSVEALKSIKATQDTIIIYGTHLHKNVFSDLYWIFNALKPTKIIYMIVANKYIKLLEPLDFSYSINSILETKEKSSFFKLNSINKYLKRIFVDNHTSIINDKYDYIFNPSDFYKSHFENTVDNHLNLPDYQKFLQLCKKFVDNSIIAGNYNDSTVLFKKLTLLLGTGAIKNLNKRYEKFYNESNICLNYEKFCKDFFLELFYFTKNNGSYRRFEKKNIIQIINQNLQSKKTKLHTYYQNLIK